MLDQLVAEYRQRRSAGLSRDAMLEELYRRGVGLVDAIKVVRLVDGAPLWEAGRAVTAHPTWAAARPRTRHFTLGIPLAAPVTDIVAVAGPALGVPFWEHDSSYYGGQYFLADSAGAEEIRIYRNYDPQDRAPVYADATDCPTLIAFSGPSGKSVAVVYWRYT